MRAGANEDGGVTGVMKLATLAESFGLDVELHGGSLAQRHITATLRNSNYYGVGLVHPNILYTKAPIYADNRWMDEPDSVDENGCVDGLEGPGLGVELNWDFINTHKTGETVFD